MKFIIEGSQSELTELIKRLGGIEIEAKNADYPPLLTELAESENIDYIQSGREIADTIKHTREVISSLKKMKGAGQSKENAPQEETAEQKTNQEILEKQMKLLSTTSENCAKFDELVAHVPALTHAMIEIQSYLRQDPV